MSSGPPIVPNIHALLWPRHVTKRWTISWWVVIFQPFWGWRHLHVRFIHYNIILYIAYIIWPHITCFVWFLVCVWYNAERHVHVAHLAPARFPWGKVKKILAIENFQKVIQSNATWREGEHGQHFLNLTSKDPQETRATYLGPVVSCKISLSLHLDERHQDFTRTSLFRWWLAALVSGEYPPKMTKHFKCVCGHNSARSNPHFFGTHQSDGKNMDKETARLFKSGAWIPLRLSILFT
jgi:hypothetical protein